MTLLLLIVGFLVILVVLSLVVEAMRPRPEAPPSLYWDPAITIQYALDYDKGRGITRGNLVAKLVFTLARWPVLGETVMRLRNPMVERRIMEGGVADPAALTPGFLAQLVASGARAGHYRAFLNLIRHAHLWEDARQVYGQIGIPVLVVYGERDWSYAEDRRRTADAIPVARLETVPAGGHFLSLDQPERLAELIRGFA